MEAMTHDDLGLREALTVLKRRLWLIILIPLVLTGLAWLISTRVLTPVYSTSTTLWIVQQNANALDYTTLMTNRDLAQTYAEVARSRSVIEQALSTQSLGGLSVAWVQARLKVEPISETEMIRLSFSDTDPARAAKLADLIAAAFIGRLGSYVKLSNVAVVDPAYVPTVPVRPRPVIISIIAGTLGLLISLGLAFVLEYTDTTVKTAAQIEAALGLTTLAVIPRIALRASAVPEPDAVDSAIRGAAVAPVEGEVASV